MGTATLERQPAKSAPRPKVATFSTTGGAAVDMLSRGEMIPWAGTIVVEGPVSGDRRTIAEGALTWPDLPLPLMAQWANPVGGDGHDGAVLAGRIDTIERLEGGKVFATGWIDPAAPGGPTLVNALDKQLMRGISVDLDDVDMFAAKTARGPGKVISAGRVRGATATPFQAFVEATIELTNDESVALAASGRRPRRTARVWTPYDPIETLAESIDHGALVASGSRSTKIPVDPPKAWFEKRDLTEYTPLTITADGQVFGHIAQWGTCHISFGRCVPVPRSQTNYAAFRNGSVVTAEGDTIRTGPLVMDTVHPDLKWRASDAMAFYAHSGSAMADVVPYEDKYGIQLAGALRPDVTGAQLRALRGSDISPDWRTVNGRHNECVALLAVNNSGFKPQLKALAASAGQYVRPGETAVAYDGDDVFALVASGAVHTPGVAGIEPDVEPVEMGSCSGDTESCGCGCTDHDDEPVVDRTVRELNARHQLKEVFGVKYKTFRVPKPPPPVRVFRSASTEFARGCNDASCAPPPAGTGGSLPGGASGSGGPGSGGRTFTSPADGSTDVRTEPRSGQEMKEALGKGWVTPTPMANLVRKRIRRAKGDVPAAIVDIERRTGGKYVASLNDVEGEYQNGVSPELNFEQAKRWVDQQIAKPSPYARNAQGQIVGTGPDDD